MSTDPKALVIDYLMLNSGWYIHGSLEHWECTLYFIICHLL